MHAVTDTPDLDSPCPEQPGAAGRRATGPDSQGTDSGSTDSGSTDSGGRGVAGLIAETAGRSCPLSYRYRPGDIAALTAPEAEVLWVVGGLYGNLEALDAVQAAVARETTPAQILFNGDFHWFDADPDWFAEVDRRVASHTAIRGNVETELDALGGDNGCGCAYPDWVDDGVVDRSNAIMRRLRGVAAGMPARVAALSALPMFAAVQVGSTRVGVVHGDLRSLAGWQMTPEELAVPGAPGAVNDDMRHADIDILASTHTCISLFRRIGHRLVINNGAAGMPNFSDVQGGVVTRIACTPPPQGLHVLYGDNSRGTHVHAIALSCDDAAWQRRFCALWPAGSPAHESYFDRICHGTSVRLADVSENA